ncbi:MAG: fatty acid desaturase, partial [Sphingomonas sp.]
MQNSIALDRSDAEASATAKPRAAKIADDKAMLRAAAEMARDLAPHRPGIYWADLIASVVIGYGALFVAVTANGWALG